MEKYINVNPESKIHMCDASFLNSSHERPPTCLSGCRHKGTALQIFIYCHLHLTNCSTPAAMTNGMIINNMSFKVGQTLTVVGVAEEDATRFAVNIGHSEQYLTLHINPRFSYGGDANVVVCNSNQGGSWGQECRERSFPFRKGNQFKIITIFTATGFLVILSDGSMIRFPNRLGSQKYSFFSFTGDARIKSLEIM
ncbi:beta-galactoside-binding lectin-like [Melanotaenia boesemani]|uniref:beta-galactoside-binding lectin-like n=1 Tax=Melanotaenia boesemani TaxID=1250792 RepID=UPI001C04A6AD|nr:beta-galactoside-binding lectin-like [Melanotaenia boesemani]